MKLTNALTILLVISVIFASCKQHRSELSNNTIEYAYRKGRGNIDTIILDKKTPLNVLIKRLEKPWTEVETGAAYWIGYTDDMFSIASYRDGAIKPLMDFISKTDSLRAKIGALYTIHLIGISSIVVGRTYEEFRDTLARKALLSYIKDSELCNTALLLLRRDPWPSDLQTYFDFLKSSSHDINKVLYVLKRYNLVGVPFWQKLPQDLQNKNVHLLYSYPEFPNSVARMISLNELFKNKLVIDKEIKESAEWQRTIDSLKSKKRISVSDGQIKLTDITTNNLSGSVTVEGLLGYFQYCPYEGGLDFFENPYYYSYLRDTLHFYGPIKSSGILLDWWSNLSRNGEQ